MSSRSVMERSTAYIRTAFREGDVVAAACVVRWLLEDTHDKLAAQLGLLVTPLSGSYRCPGPSQAVLKLIWVIVIYNRVVDACIPRKNGTGASKKTCRRNSPWYSLKFSSTTTPPSLRSALLPPLLRLRQQPWSRLVASRMPPWTVHDHFDEFIKLAAFLIEMEKWRKQVMVRRKAISPTRGVGATRGLQI